MKKEYKKIFFSIVPLLDEDVIVMSLGDKENWVGEDDMPSWWNGEL